MPLTLTHSTRGQEEVISANKIAPMYLRPRHRSNYLMIRDDRHAKRGWSRASSSGNSTAYPGLAIPVPGNAKVALGIAISALGITKVTREMPIPLREMQKLLWKWQFQLREIPKLLGECQLCSGNCKSCFGNGNFCSGKYQSCSGNDIFRLGNAKVDEGKYFWSSGMQFPSREMHTHWIIGKPVKRVVQVALGLAADSKKGHAYAWPFFIGLQSSVVFVVPGAGVE